MLSCLHNELHNALADLRGAPGTSAPLWVQFLSFSCNFREDFSQIIGCHSYLGGWRPRLGNPGSSTVISAVCSSVPNPVSEGWVETLDQGYSRFVYTVKSGPVSGYNGGGGKVVFYHVTPEREQSNWLMKSNLTQNSCQKGKSRQNKPTICQ